MVKCKTFLIIFFLSFLLTGLAIAQDDEQHKVDDKPKAAADPEMMKRVEAALMDFAAGAGSMDISNKEEVYTKLISYLESNDFIYGATFAFAPVKDGDTLVKSSPYVYRNGDEISEVDLNESYESAYEEQQWYFEPANSGKPFWSDPYFDEGGGNVWMITYSIPVYTDESNSNLLGIVTSDVMIPEKEKK